METPPIAQASTSCWIVGAGLLGRALAARLRTQGVRVLTLDFLPGADVVGDAADGAVLVQACARLMPQVVYCCQATHGGGVDAYRRAYIDVVAQLYATLPRVRVVLCSSTSVYGQVSHLVTESTEPVAPTERAAVLLAAESQVLSRGGVVGRLAPLYGSCRCEVLRRHLTGEPMLPGADDRMLNYVHVDDAVDALLLLSSAECGIYNVSGESYVKSELYRMLREVCGAPGSEVSAPGSERGVSDRRVDSSRLRGLGWQPLMSLREFAQSSINT